VFFKSHRWIWRGLVLVLLAATLSGCQAYPRPFEDENKAENKLLFLAGRGGIVVLPVEGAPSPEGLARAVADELQRHDLAASIIRTSDEATSLAGTAKQRQFDAGRDEIELDWLYKDAEGKVLGSDSGRWLVPAEPWRNSDPSAFLGVALASGPSLARLIEGDKKSAPDDRRRVIVYPVDGAPGDGRTSLKQAMERALQRRSIKIETEAEDGTLVVLGTVKVTPAGAGQDHVAISWSVINHEGQSLGVIDQENTIRAGMLDGPWGDIAVAVADAAAGGLADLMAAISASAAD
jgi:hypothetical protein